MKINRASTSNLPKRCTANRYRVMLNINLWSFVNGCKLFYEIIAYSLHVICLQAPAHIGRTNNLNLERVH